MQSHPDFVAALGPVFGDAGGPVREWADCKLGVVDCGADGVRRRVYRFGPFVSNADCVRWGTS